MTRIALYFWQLCLLRQTPAQIPSSGLVTTLIAVTYLAIALAAVSMTRPGQPFTAVAGTVMIGVVLQALVTWLLLLFKSFPARFLQTWAALLGANAVMLIVLVPFNFIILNTDNRTLMIFADSATWVCFGWWLAIAGHIYHKAVNISIIQGSVIAFLVELLSVIIAYNLFPR